MNTARRSSHLPPQLAPRLLSREASAEYASVGATKFDEMVKDGRMPAPIRIDGVVRWHRVALDHAIDRLAGLDDPEKSEWGNAT